MGGIKKSNDEKSTTFCGRHKKKEILKALEKMKSTNVISLLY
jgi:hypothetical protein